MSRAARIAALVGAGLASACSLHSALVPAGGDGGPLPSDGGGGSDATPPGSDGGGPGGTDSGVPCVGLACPCVAPAGLDFSMYPEPLVTLPPAGGAWVDPTFGSTIVRVTDSLAAGSGGAEHAMSDVPAFNAGATRFHLDTGGGDVHLFSFDAATDAVAD
ncbi:MAG TPA: hypothetical protein VG389_04645, partial [Myxococcota bacterium]|nr:hypothetical protein [Myxococcota bacterium]